MVEPGSFQSALMASGLASDSSENRRGFLSDGSWGVHWVKMIDRHPRDGENVIYWVENNLQDVPGRWQYSFDKYLSHAIEAGNFEVTHWARVNIPEDSRHAGKSKVIGRED